MFKINKMVASSTTTPTTTAAPQQNGVTSSGAAASTTNGNNNITTLPKGKYTLVGIDIDTTGRRLIDEVSVRSTVGGDDNNDDEVDLMYVQTESSTRENLNFIKSLIHFKVEKSRF